MPCPTGAEFAGFETAMNDLDLWRAIYCTYGTPVGETVVGTLFYGGVSLGIFIRTGSIGIPSILFVILGSTIIAQMLSVVTPFIAFIVLLAAPIAATAIIWTVDRLG